MNRNFYTLAIFVTALYLLWASFQGVLYIEHGFLLYKQQSISAWFIFGVVMYVPVSGFLLKYFHYKEYRFAFYALVINTLIFVCHSIIIYSLWLKGELASYSNITTFLLHGTGILCATSLIFSMSGRRPWLRTAGIFVLIHQTLLLWVTISFIT